jgi:hypothetical protein
MRCGFYEAEMGERRKDKTSKQPVNHGDRSLITHFLQTNCGERDS